MASTKHTTKNSQIPKPAGRNTDTENRVVRKARKSYEGTAPGLSLQGPFNPSVLAAISAKHGDRTEDKRKRQGSGTGRRSTGNDGTDRRRVSGGKTRSPGSGDFLTVPNPDVPRPKRNQVKEQQKCKVEFSSKANTTFTPSDTTHPKFTASVNKTNRDHHKPTATKGYRELQKSEELLQKKVASLEIKVKGLEQLQIKASKLEKENVDLQNRLSAEETTHQETREKLESKIDNCMKKLEDCSIDPVTLDEDNSLDQRSIQTKRREAQDSCEELSESLSRMKDKCKDILSDINNFVDDE